jgi:CRISPR-associated protein Cmr6
MIIGLGGKGPLEIGITLDYITGLPVIPGSALKGLTRTYALYTIAEQCGVPVLTAGFARAYHGADGREDEKRTTPLQYLDEWLAAPEAEKNGARARADVMRDLMRAVNKAVHLGAPVMAAFDPDALEAAPDAELFRLVFGSNAQSGAVVFHEAVVSSAATGKLFALDVMTPHFKQYYDDANSSNAPRNPPADNDGPNPINFITVADGTEFEFAVGVRAGAAVNAPLRQGFWRIMGPEVDTVADSDLQTEICRTAANWLLKAVGAFGVGGKTASGYGHFVKIKG